MPAGGQGAVGIETRTDDSEIIKLLEPLNHTETELRVRAERALNHRLQGGCQVPIACYATLTKNEIFLRGLVGSVDGKKILYAQASSSLDAPEALGIKVADDLLAQGAEKILADVYGANT